MPKIVVGHFEADGALIYVPIGFVPDRFLLIDFHTNTNIVFYWWFERMEDDQASGKQEGISVAEGVTANLADDGGIVAYSTGAEGPTVGQWTASTAYTARTATAHGSYVKGTTAGTDVDGNSVDRSAIFECVTAGTTGTTQPTWPVSIGENSASDNGVVWQKVNVALTRVGYQGVRIAAALMTNGQEMYYEAVLADNSEDLGDVDGWTGGVYGA